MAKKFLAAASAAAPMIFSFCAPMAQHVSHFSSLAGAGTNWTCAAGGAALMLGLFTADPIIGAVGGFMVIAC